MSGIERKQKWAAQILANFLFSHHSVQEVSWGTAEKWTVVAGSRHWRGASHHYQWLPCASLTLKARKKASKKGGKKLSPRASLIYFSPISTSNIMTSNYQDLCEVNVVLSNHLLPPLTGYLTAIYSSVCSSVRPVADQEMKSRSLRLDGVIVPCSAHWSLLPQSRLWGSSCHSCSMDLSKMPYLGDPSVLFLWKQATGDASPFRSGHKYLLPDPWSHWWLCCSTFPSFGVFCVERETWRREVKPGQGTAGRP